MRSGRTIRPSPGLPRGGGVAEECDGVRPRSLRATAPRQFPLHPYTLRHLERILAGVSYPEIVSRVQTLHGQLRKPVTVLDGTGVGKAAVELFRQSGCHTTGDHARRRRPHRPPARATPEPRDDPEHPAKRSRRPS
jgi:hypothetical protein